MVSLARVRVCLALASVIFTATITTAQQRTEFGTLSIQVRPPDAEIVIDGERWTGSEGNAPLQVQLSPGNSPRRDAIARTTDVLGDRDHPFRRDDAAERLATGPDRAIRTGAGASGTSPSAANLSRF